MDNPHCPDFTAHAENAVDAHYPAGAPDRIPSDEWELIDAATEAEYLACEGH